MLKRNDVFLRIEGEYQYIHTYDIDYCQLNAAIREQFIFHHHTGYPLHHRHTCTCTPVVAGVAIYGDSHHRGRLAIE